MRNLLKIGNSHVPLNVVVDTDESFVRITASIRDHAIEVLDWVENPEQEDVWRALAAEMFNRWQYKLSIVFDEGYGLGQEHAKEEARLKELLKR